MKSRKKGLHYGIILGALVNIIIGLSGYVLAAPQDEPLDKEAENEKLSWEELVPDPGVSKFSSIAKVAIIDPLDGDLCNYICMVKWRNTDNMINMKQEATGWYDTLGTLISDVAVVAVPTTNLRVNFTTTTSEWYVRSMMCGFHQTSGRKEFVKDDLTVYFHDKFGMSRDSSHRLALVILKSPIDSSLGMKTAQLVGHPLVPRTEDPNVPDYDDYAVTACKMVVMKIDHTTEKFTLSVLDVIATRCIWNEDQSKNPAYEDRLCVYLKIPHYPTELLSDRMFYPHDQGAPMFCNGLLTGVFAGVQNLNGNRYGNSTAIVRSADEVHLGGRLTTPEEQYVFEVPGSALNWKFVSGLTSKDEHLSWHTTMKVLKDDDCPAADYPPKPKKTGGHQTLEPEAETKPPYDPDDDTTEGYDAELTAPTDSPTDKKKTAEKVRPRGDDTDSGAARVHHVVTALAAAALGALLLV